MANFTALKTAINNAIKTNGNEEITGAILQAILDAMVETLGDSAINDLENAITTEVTNRENAVGDVAADLAAEVQARQALDYNVNNRINAEEYNRQNADAALSQTMSQGFQTLGSQMTALNAAISALNAAYQNGYLYGGIATPSSSPSNNKCFYIALQGGTYTNFGGVGVVEGINIIKNDSGWKVEHIYDQTTLLNEFYLLRQQVIRAISSIDPIVIQGDVTNAPDEEDLTSDAQHLLKFKDRAYSPLNFSGLGMKILRKNIAPLSDSAAFNGFVEGVTAEETLAGTPELIFWDRMNTRFVGIKDGVYYLDWTDSDNYVPVSTSLVYMYNGTPYQWTGSDFIVDETEVPNLVNCLTQDMINEANTIYIIRYDYTLKENITIPANCVLQFDGGSISGEYTLTGTNTGIQADLVKIFSIDVTFAGDWINKYLSPQWFGAYNDGINDDTAILELVLKMAVNTNISKILLTGDYAITTLHIIGNQNGSVYTQKRWITIDGENNARLISLDNSSDIICYGNEETEEHCRIKVYLKGFSIIANDNTKCVINGKVLMGTENNNIMTKMSDLFISGFKGIGIDCGAMTECIFNNIRLEGNGGDSMGIRIFRSVLDFYSITILYCSKAIVCDRSAECSFTFYGGSFGRCTNYLCFEKQQYFGTMLFLNCHFAENIDGEPIHLIPGGGSYYEVNSGVSFVNCLFSRQITEQNEHLMDIKMPGYFKFDNCRVFSGQNSSRIIKAIAGCWIDISGARGEFKLDELLRLYTINRRFSLTKVFSVTEADTNSPTIHFNMEIPDGKWLINGFTVYSIDGSPCNKEFQFIFDNTQYWPSSSVYLTNADGTPYKSENRIVKSGSTTVAMITYGLSNMPKETYNFVVTFNMINISDIIY